MTADGPRILPFGDKTPKVDDSAFVAPGASVIGDVEIGADSSVWFGCVLRGDVHEIRVGARVNIQDGTVVHVAGDKFGTYIGDDVTIGHNALIHACTLQPRSFVGMSATVMDGAVVESGGMVAAGALVSPGKVVRAGELWAGVPARKVRDLTEDDAKAFLATAKGYVELSKRHIQSYG